MINDDSGWWFQAWLLFSISYMGCHPKPIDKNIFSEGYVNRQPDEISTNSNRVAPRQKGES